MTKVFVTKNQFFITKNISDEIFLSQSPSAKAHHYFFFVMKLEFHNKKQLVTKYFFSLMNYCPDESPCK